MNPQLDHNLSECTRGTAISFGDLDFRAVSGNLNNREGIIRMSQNAQTLTARLASGSMPLSDALRYALQIADALRHAHEQGYCHGAITPDAIMLTPDGAELIPALPGAVEALTPYTAPERLKGRGPDARTDIYALGAILYEMFTGKRAFDAPDEEALAEAIENSLPAPIGDTALDRLVLNCLVKEPSGRWQRVQQVHMEIKIFTFSAKRAQAAAAPRPETVSPADLRQIETRLHERLDQFERAFAVLQQETREQAEAMQLAARLDQHELALVGLQQVAAEQSTVLGVATQTLGGAESRIQSLETQLAAALERAEQAQHLADQLTEGAKREAAALQVSLAGELHAIELTVKAHTAAIESIRGAMARTDDFMERVVEALESLQTMVLERVNDQVPA